LTLPYCRTNSGSLKGTSSESDASEAGGDSLRQTHTQQWHSLCIWTLPHNRWSDVSIVPVVQKMKRSIRALVTTIPKSFDKMTEDLGLDPFEWMNKIVAKNRWIQTKMTLNPFDKETVEHMSGDLKTLIKYVEMTRAWFEEHQMKEDYLIVRNELAVTENLLQSKLAEN
jgi:hypothetical protein